MKKIIVPTDFSYASKDALAYALSIAPLLDAAVEIVHIYSGSFSVDYPFSVRPGMGRYDSLIEDLKSFATFETEGGVIVRQDVKMLYNAIGGTPERELIKLSKYPDTIMMVLGKTGKGASKGRLFGSISRDISQKAHCPVLLVPKGKGHTSIDNILYASDYGAVDQPTLQKAVDTASIFDAAIHFVHVNEGSTNDFDHQAIEERIFDFLFEKTEPSFAFNLVSIPSSTVVGGLNQYIRENDIDLLIMVAHHRNFLSNMFLKSMTKEMAHYSNIPILVFHKK